MAELHVQEKRRSAWPWILGALFAVLLIWIVVERNDADEYATGDVVATPVAPAPAIAPAPVSSVDVDRFVVFATDPTPDFGNMNAAHTYTRNGLRYLASALDEVARSAPVTGQNIQPSIAALRQGAEALSEDAAGPEHAAALSRVINQAAEVMRELQRARFPESADEVSRVGDAARRISANEAILEQREAVREFFSRAATAVQSMGAPAPGNQSTDTGGTR